MNVFRRFWLYFDQKPLKWQIAFFVLVWASPWIGSLVIASFMQSWQGFTIGVLGTLWFLVWSITREFYNMRDSCN